jgi:hypothetical protein
MTPSEVANSSAKMRPAYREVSQGSEQTICWSAISVILPNLKCHQKLLRNVSQVGFYLPLVTFLEKNLASHKTFCLISVVVSLCPSHTTVKSIHISGMDSLAAIFLIEFVGSFWTHDISDRYITYNSFVVKFLGPSHTTGEIYA